MPEFSSVYDLKRNLVKRCKDATREVTQEVEDLVEDYAIEYYRELPQENLVKYKRQGRLTSLLGKGAVEYTGDGYASDVHYDNAWNYKNKGESGWDNKTIVDVNMNTHTHGGYYLGGTAVWKDSLEELDIKKHSIAKDALINAGIPVE